MTYQRIKKSQLNFIPYTTSAGEFNTLNPITTPAVGDFILFEDISDSNNKKGCTIQDLINLTEINLSLNDLNDINRVSNYTKDSIVLFVGNNAGNGYSAVNLIAGTALSAIVVTDTSVTLNVSDIFLHNTSDSFDSGTLTIAPGASLSVSSGATITAIDPPLNPHDLTNKAYVDQFLSFSITWKDPIVDPNLADIISANVSNPQTVYGMTVGDRITLLVTTTAGFTASFGSGTTVSAVTGDVLDLTITSSGNGDYRKIKSISAGDRFICLGEEDTLTLGSTLSTLDINSDSFTVSKGDLLQFKGTGDGSISSNWTTPEGRSGQAGGGTEIKSGLTVLVSNSTSEDLGHCYMYSSDINKWIEIIGPRTTEAGTGLAYSGNILNVQLGAGIVELPSQEVGIDLYNTSTSALILTTDGSTRATTTDSQLYLLLNGSTLTQNSSGLKISSNGVTSTELNSSVAGLGISGGNGTSLSFTPSELSNTALETGDYLVLSDISVSETPIKREISSFFTDFNIVNNITSDGIIVRISAGNYLSLSIGIDGQVLTVDSTQATGLRWATPTVGTVTSIAATAPAAGLTISGSPITASGTLTFALANDLGAIEALNTNGILARTGTDTWAARTLTGTANQITVTNGNGIAGNPVVSIPNNPILPGTATVTLPTGTTAQQVNNTGGIRYNSTLGIFEGYNGTSWVRLDNITGSGSGATGQLLFTNIGHFTTTSQIPSNALPTVSQGVQIASLTITPTAVTSDIFISASFTASNAANRIVSLTIWRGSTLVGVACASIDNRVLVITSQVVDSPNTISPITYTFRVGQNGGGTVAINDSTLSGGALVSSASIKEIY